MTREEANDPSVTMEFLNKNGLHKHEAQECAKDSETPEHFLNQLEMLTGLEAFPGCFKFLTAFTSLCFLRRRKISPS